MSVSGEYAAGLCAVCWAVPRPAHDTLRSVGPRTSGRAGAHFPSLVSSPSTDEDSRGCRVCAPAQGCAAGGRLHPLCSRPRLCPAAGDGQWEGLRHWAGPGLACCLQGVLPLRMAPSSLCAAGSCASILCAPGHCHSALCPQALGPDTEAPQVSPATRSQLTRARTGLGSAHAPWSALSSGTPWVWRVRGKGAAGSRPGV